jgi:hypothetical protein
MRPARLSGPLTFAALLYLPVQATGLVRPPLLTHISAFARARCARRLQTPIDRSCSATEDGRLSGRALVLRLCSNGSHLFLTALLRYSCLQPAVMPTRLPQKVSVAAMRLNNFHRYTCREVVLTLTGWWWGRIDGLFPFHQSLNEEIAARW